MAHCMKLFTWTCHPGIIDMGEHCMSTQQIKSVEFQPSKTDYSLFTRQNNSSFTALLIYVDDILLTVNDLTEIQRVKNCLLQQFRIKDLGDLKYFLGIEFSRSKVGIYMS